MTQPKSPAGQPFWQARTGSGLHPDLLAFSQTVVEDRPFVVHDLAGSSAHVIGLAKAGLITSDEAAKLLQGLRAILRDHEAGAFVLRAELEDLHMNIEERLTAELGDTGRKLHTGRSRNDQVATCIVLYARSGLAQLAQALLGLSDALARQATAHVTSPWVARTHGQPAQPATFGFLLAAHAARFQDAAAAALAVFDLVGESPLGCGAVTGSTLPLDPAFTARLLGLRPPRNALLATGSRDAVVRSCGAASMAGIALAGLAQDLLDLFAAGAVKLPPGYTTGSSLMPQKRNPDALELARGRGKALVGPLAAVTGIVSGLGLGYQRDFQLTKPWLVQALGDATTTAELLAPLVDGLAYDARAAAAEWSKAGILATDVAEALVRTGMPFRTAYAAAAQAYAKVEAGATLQDAIIQADLEPHERAAAMMVLQPDPSRRATTGGPAPAAVASGLAALASSSAALAARVAATQQSVERPLDLLSRPIPELLEAT